MRTTAFSQNAGAAALVRVRNGTQAVDYLCGVGDYADRQKHPFPQLIVLDLTIPQKTGFQVLEWFEKQPEPSLIPVVILSACEDPAVIQKAFSLGANSYLIKPRDYGRYVRLVQLLQEYWLEWNQPPAFEQEQASRIFACPPARPEPPAADARMQA